LPNVLRDQQVVRIWPPDCSLIVVARAVADISKPACTRQGVAGVSLPSIVIPGATLRRLGVCAQVARPTAPRQKADRGRPCPCGCGLF
jgi:hypothetical protein